MPVFTDTKIFGNYPGSTAEATFPTTEEAITDNYGKIPTGPAGRWVSDRWGELGRAVRGRHEPPARPRPGGTRVGEAPGSYSITDAATELAYQNLLRDAAKRYATAEVPEAELLSHAGETGNYLSGILEGYETGNSIWINAGLPPDKKLVALSHEYAAKKLKEKTGRTHDELHPEIYRFEQTIADQYLRQAFKAVLESHKN